MKSVKRSLRKRFPKKSYRKRRVTRVSRSLSTSRAYLFKRSYQGIALLNNSSGNVAGGYAFVLADLPSATEFTLLFDQYKICAVKIKFIPQSDTLQNLTTGPTSNYCGSFFYVYDYDDSTAPTTSNQLCEYQNMQVRNPMRPFSMYLKPKAVTVVSGGSGTTANSGALKSQWIDCQNTTVPHYGVRYFWTQAVASAQTLMPIVTYYIKCKNVR